MTINNEPGNDFDPNALKAPAPLDGPNEFAYLANSALPKPEAETSTDSADQPQPKYVDPYDVRLTSESSALGGKTGSGCAAAAGGGCLLAVVVLVFLWIFLTATFH